MKKNLIACTAVLALFLSCNKNTTSTPTTNADTTAPVLVLNGNAKDTVVLNSTYTDAGATATDNVDGNISANVVVAGNLNMNQTGDYQRTYNVQDAAGNAASQATRLIHVRNEAYFLTGNYAVVPNCGSTPSSNYNTSISVSSTVNRLFTFSSLQSNYTGLVPTATLGVARTNFTLTSLSGNNATFGGSGVINSASSINLSSAIGQPGVIGVYFCNSSLTKQ
jgi:hypothetical protein